MLDMDKGTRLPATAVDLLRTGVGLLSCLRHESDPIARRGVRVAGVRHVGQAALSLAVPELRILGVAVDALHAASMLAVAGVSRRFRRPALWQAALATALLVAESRAISDQAPARRRKRPR